MSDRLIGERYANGLSQAIEDSADLEPALEAVQRMAKLFTTNHDLHNALTNPAVAYAVRERVLDDVIKAEGAPDVVKRLLHLLMQAGRIGYIDTVAQLFSNCVDARLGRVRAKVYTAHEPSEEIVDRLRGSLETFSKKTVLLETAIDDDMIGGVRAEIGGLIIDGSLRSRVERLKAHLIAQEVTRQ